MSHTKGLLLKIKTAVLDSRLPADINYIKMDIEGAEQSALAGAVEIPERCDDIRCAICFYHCWEDEQEIRHILEKHGLETETSRGYMCPDWTMEAYLEAELRRGIVFGRKKAR